VKNTHPLDPAKQLSVGKVAEYCQVNRVTVQRWIHAGKLKAHSLPGGHYRVLVADLKAFFETNVMPLPPAFQDGSRNGPKRILIVDDSERDRRLLKAALDEKNDIIAIEESSSGIDALIRIGAWKPDLVILDIIMPQMDGFEVVRKISANPLTRDTRVLIVTGYSIEQAKHDLDGYSIAGFVGKPVNINEIRETVKTLLKI
jgi:excisionase family DNA binding protein